MNMNLLPSSNKPEEKDKTEIVDIVVPDDLDTGKPDPDDEYAPIDTFEEELADDSDIDDIIILDNMDETPQNEKVTTFEFNDEDKRKVFFDSSMYHNERSEIKNEPSLFDVFEFYRKESKYKDVYLPVTNVAVRIFEFNNLDILINKLTLESEKDFAYRTAINRAGSQSRDFLQKIFDNAEFLTSDGKDLTPVHFEAISALDAPFLVLAATELMGEIYDSTDGSSGHKIDDTIVNGLDIWQDTCESCETPQRLFKNVKEILQAQYTEEMIDYANKNYDPNDTLENNIKRSKKVKAKGIKYTKGESGIETLFYLKDPDWIRSHDYDNAFDNYFINKYINNKYIKDLPDKLGKEWLNMTPREKAVQIQLKVNELSQSLGQSDILSLEELRDLSNKILLDIQNFTITKYLHMVKTVNNKKLDQNGNPTTLSTTMMHELTLEQKLLFLEKYSNDEMVEKMFSQIEVLRGYGRETIEYKWKCVKCKKDNVTQLDPILFVFLLLQSKLYKREKRLSTTSSTQ